MLLAVSFKIDSVKFTLVIEGGFPLGSLFGSFEVFSFRTVKDRTFCFSTKKSAV